MMGEVNLFDLNVYVQNNKEITTKIKEKLKERNISINNLSKKINLSNSTLYPFLKGASMKSQNLKKIFDYLNIDKKNIKKVLIINSGPYGFRKYNFKFPIRINPLYVRLISHFLGDSSLEKHGCRWYQKNGLGRKYMRDLIYSLINIKVKEGKKNSYGIPIIIADIVCSALKLNRRDLKTQKFINKINHLHKEFKLQLLAAVIVDEGHITNSLIKIANTNKSLLESLIKLISSLNYSCSKIKISRNKIKKIIEINGRKARINKKLYNIFIYADGLLKFRKDIDLMIKKYGKNSGLWHKQDSLLKFSSKVNLKRLEKTRDSKNRLIPIIRKKIKNKPISIKEFSKINNIDYIRAYKLFFRLKENGEIQKISAGIFASNKYKGPTNLTLKSKIEDVLSKTPIRTKDIQKQIGGNKNSIATQLSKLLKEEKVKRIKRGIYSI